MATREHESVGPPFGIAHVTVVPENFDPGWVSDVDGGREDGRETTERVSERTVRAPEDE